MSVQSMLFGRKSLACLVAASGFAVAGSSALAAPIGYAAAVGEQNPYVSYRFGETAGTVAEDATINNRDATYVGGPTLGVAGAGFGSDTAVAFDGTTAKYANSTATGFGSLLGSSSFEFVFKTNANFATATRQDLFGAVNGPAGSTATAVQVTLNANASGNTTTNAVRLFLRDESNNAAGYTFTNAGLFDGNFHHLVFTFDDTNAAVTAYVDGVAQTVSKGSGSSGGNPGTGAAVFADFTSNPYFGATDSRGTTSQPANVTIDEAALYGSVLSAANVAAHASAVVPEPASLALLGLGGLMALRRRRQV